MRRVHDKVKRRAKTAPRDFKGGVEYVWDNSRPHQSAQRQLEEVGLKFLRIPPHSPDFNTLVEHVFNPIKYNLQHAVHHDRRITTLRQAATQLKREVAKTVTAASLHEDAKTYLRTLREIYNAGGGYPRSGLS